MVAVSGGPTWSGDTPRWLCAHSKVRLYRFYGVFGTFICFNNILLTSYGPERSRENETRERIDRAIFDYDLCVLHLFYSVCIDSGVVSVTSLKNGDKEAKSKDQS